MKTAIFYITLFVLSIIAFNVSAAYVESFENGRAEQYVEQNRAKLDPKTVEYCNKNIGFGQIAIDMRDEGLTEQDALDDLANSSDYVKKKHGRAIPTSSYLEFTRMIRTVFRHPNMTIEEYNRQFFAECIIMGGY